MSAALRNASPIGLLSLFLLAMGCSPHPLHDAIARHDVKEAKELINKGTDLSIRDEQQRTAMHVAADSGQIEIGRLLAEQRIDLNATDSAGRTALHLAAIKDRADFVELLAKKGADVKIADRFGSTPLLDAAGNGKANSVRALLDNGAPVDLTNKQKVTPLMAACAFREESAASVVRLLLERHADPKLTSEDGQTALHRAAMRPDPQAVRLLITAGADIHACAKDKTQPLDQAAMAKATASAACLLDAGAKPRLIPTWPLASAKTYQITADYLAGKGRCAEACGAYEVAIQQYAFEAETDWRMAKRYGDQAAGEFFGNVAMIMAVAVVSGGSMSYQPAITMTHSNMEHAEAAMSEARKEADRCAGKLAQTARTAAKKVP